MAVVTYTKSGTKATSPAKLEKSVFGVEVKSHELVKAAYEAYLANGRTNLAVAKTRGLVRGSTRKPHKQKGTGRARAGSVRSPLWTGGGIIFGPTGQENYSKRLNVKAKRQATRQALSIANSDNKIIVIEDIISKDGKTADVARLLTKIGATRNILIVVDQKTPELIRATRNLSNVKMVSAMYVNVYDALNADCIVMSQKALVTVNEWLGLKQARSSKEAK